MFDNCVVALATVAAIAIIFIFCWMRGNGTKDAGRRYPPSASALSLLGAVLRGGIRVLPDHLMKSAETLGPVISYNFGERRVIILNGKEAISEAFLRQSETFADKAQFWTETNILNKDLRGKRSCLGEILGRQKTFLFLTSLIQRFDIRPPEGQDSIRVKEVIAFAVFPSEFEVRFIPRIADQRIQ